MPMEPQAQAALAMLDGMGIQYRLYTHPAVRTMEDCAGIGADVGASHFKNLFLADRKRSTFVLLLLPLEKTYHASDISSQLGTSRLSFCTAEELMEKLGLVPGCVTPLALAGENAKDVILAVDEDILEMDMVCVHPCVPTATIALKRAELFRFLKGCGNEIRYVRAE